MCKNSAACVRSQDCSTGILRRRCAATCALCTSSAIASRSGVSATVHPGIRGECSIDAAVLFGRIVPVPFFAYLRQILEHPRVRIVVMPGHLARWQVDVDAAMPILRPALNGGARLAGHPPRLDDHASDQRDALVALLVGSA